LLVWIFTSSTMSGLMLSITPPLLPKSTIFEPSITGLMFVPRLPFTL
jgi:hypothetical protein